MSASDSQAQQRPHGGDPFTTTHWSVVLAAGRRDSPAAEAALADLCSAYWYPLYAYVRRRVQDPHEAQDLTQEFFARLIEKDYLAAARPERGKFRAFLLTALRHFLSKEWDKARAQKRGSGRQALPLDFASGDSRYAMEPADSLTPEQVYDRAWAVSILNRVMDRLQTDLAADGKAQQFERLKCFLIGDQAGSTYSAAAAELGASEAAIKMAVHRLRRRYGNLLREEIAQTVATAEEVEEEIRGLFAALAAE